MSYLHLGSGDGAQLLPLFQALFAISGILLAAVIFHERGKRAKK